MRIYAITRSLISAMVFDLLDTTRENLRKNKIQTLNDVRKQKSFTAKRYNTSSTRSYNNYIVDFLEEIYDTIVIWVEKRKRRRVVSEK